MRAEKIIDDLSLEIGMHPVARRAWKERITSHLEEAVREAIEHHHFIEKCCDACFDSGKENGFALAREKAARIVDKAISGEEMPAEGVAERIRAMTPGGK